MKWIGDRISFVQKEDNSISFVIYPPDIGYKKHLVTAWFALWLIIGFILMYESFQEYSKEQKLILVIILFFWAYFLVRVLKTLLFINYGREFIKLDETSLRLKSSIAKYGKAHQFFIENIEKFRVVTPDKGTIGAVYEDTFWVKGSNRVSFEYFGKVYSFGRKLNAEEARIMFQMITKRLEKLARQKKKKS